MSSFYKEWLRRNDEENLEALQEQVLPPTQTLRPSTSKETKVTQATTSNRNISEKELPINESILHQQTDIVFENDKLKLIVEKGTFQRQKRFRLQDHLFYMKVKVKNKNDPIPFLKDLFDFLQNGLLHVMQNIKNFYNSRDENLAFLTLYQQPMVTGLNSGIH